MISPSFQIVGSSKDCLGLMELLSCFSLLIRHLFSNSCLVTSFLSFSANQVTFPVKHASHWLTSFHVTTISVPADQLAGPAHHEGDDEAEKTEAEGGHEESRVLLLLHTTQNTGFKPEQ